MNAEIAETDLRKAAQQKPKHTASRKERISPKHCGAKDYKIKFQKVVYDFDIDIFCHKKKRTESHCLTARFTIETPLPTPEELLASAGGSGVIDLTYVVEAVWDGTTSYSGIANNNLQWIGSGSAVELGYAIATIDIPGLIRLKADDIEGRFDRNRVENWRVGDHLFTTPDGDASLVSLSISAVAT